ncbi:MAG TPA: hypothetical protein DHV22_11265, partial [Xanthomarina gelatinilytica]|nr:hypothetical protein [Xanthomarina gelatinilytica]
MDFMFLKILETIVSYIFFKHELDGLVCLVIVIKQFKQAMKILLTSITFVLISFQAFSQIEISEILAYEYNNVKNTFTTNVVGKESVDVDASGNQTLIVVKLNRIADKEYKYTSRELKVIVKYEGKEREEIFEEQEVVVPFVSSTFYVPF